MNDYNLDLTKTEDILIVDDTPDNLHLLSRMLTRQGYNVRKALNGSIILGIFTPVPISVTTSSDTVNDSILTNSDIL